MALAVSHGFRRHEDPYAVADLGLEPPIDSDGRKHAKFDRRQVSLRWLAGTILTGVSGAALIGAAIYAALDRQATFPQAPEYALARQDASVADPGEGLRKGDRLIKAADIVAEKQSFRVPIAMTVGDKQLIRMRGFTHVATTLALAPTGLGDEVPDFDPLKLLAADQQNPADAPADPGPALDQSEASFTVSDLAVADPAAFAGSLSKDEVQAQVADFLKAAPEGNDKPLSLPPQLMLMRTSRATLNIAGSLSYAPGNFMASPFSSIEVKMVPENVTVVQQTNSTPEGVAGEERLVTLHHGDTLEEVLQANGATRDQIRGIVTAFGAKRGEAPVAEGRRLKLLLASRDGTSPAQIARISVYADETLETTIAIEDSGDYVQVSRVEANPKGLHQARPRGDDEDAADEGGMRLYQSLYETALKQKIPKAVIGDLIRVFGNDVDYQRAVAPGDTFDAFYTDGDDDGRNDLLYASITIRDETFKYYRFQAPDDGTTDFYDESGRSSRKFLIRKPVPVGEVTSGFGVRFHPILGYSRPHTGVDWGAPVGTPILAAGNGTLLTVERNSSYGNHIEIQHANGYVTTYSHMSGFARGLVSGGRVHQGQVIGYLGQTGLATGPHLHYEVIVNGHFVDPMRVKLARTREIEGKMLASFKKEHDRIDGLMASAPDATPSDGKRASN